MEIKIDTKRGGGGGRGDKMVEARRRSERHGEYFAGPGGHSENLEA